MRAHGNKEFWLAALRADGPLFRAAVAEAAPDAPVPSCPEWTVAQLTGHLASVYGFVTDHVGRGVTTAPQRRSTEPVAASVAEFDERFAALVSLLQLSAVSARGSREGPVARTSEPLAAALPGRQPNPTA